MIAQALLLRVVGVLLLASLLVFSGCRWQARHDGKRIAAAQEQAAALRARVDALQAATREAEQRASAATDRLAKTTKEADERYAELNRTATRDAAALAAALRAGKQRLSDTWACPATASAGGDQAAAGSSAAARRSDSAARIIAAADADAAAMTWLYDRWAAEHRAVIAAGCAVEEEQ